MGIGLELGRLFLLLEVKVRVRTVKSSGSRDPGIQGSRDPGIQGSRGRVGVAGQGPVGALRCKAVQGRGGATSRWGGATSCSHQPLSLSLLLSMLLTLPQALSMQTCRAATCSINLIPILTCHGLE